MADCAISEMLDRLQELSGTVKHLKLSIIDLRAEKHAAHQELVEVYKKFDAAIECLNHWTSLDPGAPTFTRDNVEEYAQRSRGGK